MTRRLNYVLLALLLVLGLPYYWLVLDTRPGDAEPQPISIGELRALAAALPGPLPTGVKMDMAAHRLLPSTLIAAGSGLKCKLLGLISFELPVAGGKPVFIEAGGAIGAAGGIRMARYDPQALARIAQARRRAGLIIAMQSDEPGKSPSATAVALAPGIVAIPAPSHRPGTRMLFVRLADGAEYLFAGDVAPLAQSWAELRNRPRLVTDFWYPEDRRRVFDWLLTIRKLKSQAPALRVVPGYDYDWLADPASQSGVSVTFAYPRSGQ